jgi:DNA-binding transcriptional MerR regulator
VTEPWLGPRAVAQATGVSTDTLRHYERLGLLPSAQRTRAGYRRYHPSTVERVRLIQRALLIGFSLKELAAALRQREEGSPPCRRVRALVGDRLVDLDRKLRELTALRGERRRLLRDGDDRLASTPDGQRARLLDMLAGRRVLDAPRRRRTLRR